jgi:hypothetical protein
MLRESLENTMMNESIENPMLRESIELDAEGKLR